jgi:branched-chain amino acid transport system substrate-binding protein
VLFGAALAAVWTASSCGGGRGPVRIGVVLPPDFRAPALMAAEEINAAGGVRGRLLEIVRDAVPSGTPDVPSVDIVRAQSVVRRSVVAVLGHEGSGASLVAAPVYGAAKVVQLVPTGTSRLLARAGPWTLALAPDEWEEGRFIAAFVRDRLRAASVVIFHSNDRYGIGLRDAVREALAAQGIRVHDVVRFDYSADLGVLTEASLRRGAPDAVVVVGYAREAALIAQQLRAHGCRAPIVGGDGTHVMPTLVATAPGATEGMYVVTFWLPGATDSAGRAFEAAVRTRLGREPAARDAMAYDGMRLLAAAVDAVGDRPRRVLAYLRSLGVERPRYRGVTGEIGFGAGAGAPRFVMGRVEGDRVVPAGAPP